MTTYEFSGHEFNLDLSKYDDQFKIDFLSSLLHMYKTINNELKSTISEHKAVLTQLTFLMCVEKPEKKEKTNESKKD